MSFLNELYFTFLSHLFFRVDVGGFSSGAKMYLAPNVFPVLGLSCRDHEREDSFGDCDHPEQC